MRFNSLPLVIKCQTFGYKESIPIFHIEKIENSMKNGDTFLFYQTVMREVEHWQKSCPVTTQEKILLINASSVAWKLYPNVWSADLLEVRTGKSLDKTCHVEQCMERSHTGHWLSQPGTMIRLKRPCFRKEFRGALIPQQLHIMVECGKGKFI